MGKIFLNLSIPRGLPRGILKFKTTWKGYKYHIDTIDGDIPISNLLTSASVHDSQVDIPLATLTEQKVQYLYEIKDSAYDSVILRQRASDKGHYQNWHKSCDYQLLTNMSGAQISFSRHSVKIHLMT